MLVIAIPKSASTSLLDTLNKVYKIKSEQVFYDWLKYPETYSLLYKYHKDIKEYQFDSIQKFSYNKCFYKQHIPPTKNNLKLLKEEKKVILLRNPNEIIEAYWRAEQKKIHNKRQEFSTSSTKDEWIREANSNGLYDDLQDFYNGWSNVKDKYTLHISYNELIDDPRDIIQRIGEFFELPQINKKVTLSKKRYSHHGIVLTYILKFLQFYKKVMRKFHKVFFG